MTAQVKVTRAQIMGAERRLCEESFADFISRAWPHIDTNPYVDNWHIRVLADHLQAIYEGRAANRLLVNIPPGTAKSLICSVLFPAWVWTRDPSKKIISAAHNVNLSKRDSKRCRRLINSNWYQERWPIKLLDDQDAVANFANDRGGERVAMALTSMTGERGSIVIVDDPHTVNSSKSHAKRTETVETFLETIPSRVNNPETDAIIVIMQRLHEDDVSGAILSRPDLGYDHLCIPLFADDEVRAPTSIGWKDHRAEGDNMFPQRFTEKYIRGVKSSLGPLQFSGQYQQAPAPASDGFFQRDWFHRYSADDLPKRLNYFLTSDHAPSGTGDWNVFRVWGVDAQRHIWMVDSYRKKCLMDEAMGIVRDKNGKAEVADTGALALIKKWKPLGWFPEQDNTWTAVQSFVRAAMLETGVMCRISPIPTKGSGDKVGKAQSYQAMAANGTVHLPKGEVGDTALEEYQKFPVGKHDDQVDADGAMARIIAEAPPAFIPVEELARGQSRDDDEDDSRFYARTTSDACW